MAESVNGVTSAFLLVYAGLFPIVNPIGGAPIFFGLTRDCTQQERNALALQVSLNSFALLLGSLFVGSYVLEFFGITLPIVRRRRRSGRYACLPAGTCCKKPEFPTDDARAGHQPVIPTDGFYPLTMPITVGPGSIAVAITLGSQRPRVPLPDFALLGVAAVAGLVAIAATIYVCYRFASGTVGALWRSKRHQCDGAAVGVHSAVHRHRNHLERLQRPRPCRRLATGPHFFCSSALVSGVMWWT